MNIDFDILNILAKHTPDKTYEEMEDWVFNYYFATLYVSVI